MILIKKRFHFLDEIAPADAAFEAYGNTPEEMFESAALALFAVIVDLRSVENRVGHDISLTADSLESLLYDWLAELIYLKDVEREFYIRFDVTISSDDRYHLTARVFGEGIDRERHDIITDVKAVTYHRLKIEKVDNQYKAVIVLDL